MEATQAGFSVIVVDEADNPYKPERSSRESRRETALRTFGYLENVYISNSPKEEIKKELLKNKYVIALIGSDVWPLLTFVKLDLFQAYCDCKTKIPVVFPARPPMYLTCIMDKASMIVFTSKRSL